MRDSSGLSSTGSPLLFTFRQIADSLIDLFFPPRCVGCGARGSLLCDRCQASLPSVEPIRDPRSAITERRATADFEGVIQQAIHRLKYENQPRLAVPLGLRLAAELRRSGWIPSLITAAPLHEARLRQRGYNQSAWCRQEIER
ncbi:MAG TPA: double zinc ribbon domain-containing protein [Aggregatilineales bacterium]|nr:double zinc ribbon domain-containing protein [Aggregatilineales bacterium]